MPTVLTAHDCMSYMDKRWKCTTLLFTGSRLLFDQFCLLPTVHLLWQNKPLLALSSAQYWRSIEGITAFQFLSIYKFFTLLKCSSSSAKVHCTICREQGALSVIHCFY